MRFPGRRLYGILLPFPLDCTHEKSSMAAGGVEVRSADVEEDASQLLFPKGEK